MQLPFLSIITINLNNAEGLKKTIESVLNQTSPNIEYIIIDGGSTDESVDIIQSFTSNLPGVYDAAEGPASISYWISENDKGIYQAMNKGINASRGKYCQFLNSGDTLAAKDTTEKMLQNFPNTSIVIGNMLKLYSSGKIYRDKGVEKTKTTFLTFYKGTLNHSPAYIMRSLFEKYGLYDEGLKIVSDWKWYLIAVGLNDEPVTYRDIDVTLFDMNGISNRNLKLIDQEKKSVLKELIPINILTDYDNHWFDISQVKRIKRYGLTRFIFWLVERVLFKIEKLL